MDLTFQVPMQYCSLQLRKNEVAGQKQKRHLAMDVSGGESKV